MTLEFLKQLGMSLGTLLLFTCCSIHDFSPIDNEASQGTRVLHGTIPSSISPEADVFKTNEKEILSVNCTADTVLGTSTKGEIISTYVNKDCGFNLDLDVGKTYVLSFMSHDNFVANLLFDSGRTGFTWTALPVSRGEEPIDLGSIRISDKIAFPENNPLKQNDHDSDGTNDFADNDDNNNGIKDAMESDCDLDGIPNELDEADACQKSEKNKDHLAILEAKPRNEASLRLGNEAVDLERSIRFRIPCAVNRETVTSSTFIVRSETGSSVSCGFLISGKENSRIECAHEEPFSPSTKYSATVSGVQCQDGRVIEGKSWSWKTEKQDLDRGDYEDDVDFLNYIKHASVE